MTEKPILFSGAMVRAILAGAKSQTRRIVKPQLSPCNHEHWPGAPTEFFDFGDGTWACRTCGNGMQLIRNDAQGFRCPYGSTGAYLWVRETWSPHDQTALTLKQRPYIYYRADDATKYESDGAWRPSIHMPRWASRITLEITDIRVERLQEITEEDAVAEGIDAWTETLDSPHQMGKWCNYTVRAARSQSKPRPLTANQIGAFAYLWDSINGDGSWHANPWVWRVSFRRI